MKIGLVKKLLFWFVIVILLSFAALDIISSAIIDGNNESVIKNDMLDLKSNCDIYISRSILSRGLDASEASFEQAVFAAADGMYALLGRQMAFYRLDGSEIYSTINNDAYVPGEDLAYAQNGSNAYTIVYGDQTYVFFSFPIYYESTNVGVMRIKSDYTTLYKRGGYEKTMVMFCAVGILLAALVLLLIFMGRVIGPVKRLGRSIEAMTADGSEPVPLPANRSDEIGELTRAYNQMAKTIHEQFLALGQEKENLQKTLAYRKNFYDNMTHELKTPLTIILGYAELMQQTGFADGELNEKGTGEIINETKHLRDMVVDLLEASKQADALADTFEYFDLSALLETVAVSMEIKAERYGMAIEKDIAEDVHMTGSPEKLRQLFVNLIDNAIKYGAADRTIRLSLSENEEGIAVAVENGIDEGFIEDDPERLFDPYYQADAGIKRDGSMGLGLAICRSIAAAHGGTISPDIGEKTVRMTIRLPRQAEGSAEK